MADVYANGMEISCKSASGKSICAFPDVCMSPPSPPAGPIPLPYPNTAMASDMTDGSKSVKISDGEVMLKDQSNFKKSSGDEAATKAWGMGVVTHQIQGKAFFIAWSMDVKFEGENVPRHLDMTTHNHGSNPPDTPPIVYADRMSLLIASGDCSAELEKIDEACDPPEEKAKCPSTKGVAGADAALAALPKGPSVARDEANEAKHKAHEQYMAAVRDDPCLDALSCALTSHSKGKAGACCPPQTPEHLIPASSFGTGRGAGHPKYKPGKAPCSCAEGHATQASHGLLGAFRRDYQVENNVGSSWTVGEAATCGATSFENAFPGCTKECVESQLLLGHQQMGIQPSDPASVVNTEGILEDTSGVRAELMIP